MAQSSEGIFREELDAPLPIDLPEDELIQRILDASYIAECNDAMARMYGFTSGNELLGKRITAMLLPGDPRNVEMTQEYVRSGFRVLDRESHEVDVHGNRKIFRNSLIGIIENGNLVRTWGIQRDVTEQVRLEKARTEGQFPVSREMVSALQFMAFVWVLFASGEHFVTSLSTFFRESPLVGVDLDLERDKSGVREEAVV